jgi:hypothetical protein
MIRLLVDSQHATQAALALLLDQGTPPEVEACVSELRYAATWFCGALERHLPRVRDREKTGDRLGLSEQLTKLPTLVDRLRVIARAQRWMLAQMAVLLADDLEPGLRQLLQEASAICLRSGRRCDEVIATLDHGRERPPPMDQQEVPR